MSEDSLSEQQQLLAKLAELEQLMTKVYIHDTRFQLVSAELQATKVALRDYVKDYFDDLLVGSVSAFAMTTPPEGWLECNGQEVSRTTYAQLFQRISTTFGEGDGSTTFNLPDLTGVFIRGWDADGKRDPDREFGSYQADQMQSHTRKDSGHSHSGKTSDSGSHSHSGKSDTDGNHSHSGKSDTDGSHSHSGSTSTNGKHDHQILDGNKDIFGDEYAIARANVGTKSWWSNPINYGGEHSHSFSTNSAGSHYHVLDINSAGSHWHDLDINSAGSHSHTISTNNSSATLGNPVSSSSGNVRHGNETRTKNVALMYCIKY